MCLKKHETMAPFPIIDFDDFAMILMGRQSTDAIELFSSQETYYYAYIQKPNR